MLDLDHTHLHQRHSPYDRLLQEQERAIAVLQDSICFVAQHLALAGYAVPRHTPLWEWGVLHEEGAIAEIEALTRALLRLLAHIPPTARHGRGIEEEKGHAHV